MNTEPQTETSTQETVTSGQRQFIVLWSVFIFALFVGVGILLAAMQHNNKIAAIERHLARVDPNAPEPGKTEADPTRPPGTEDIVPVDVRAGIYVDRVLQLSMKDSKWVVDFYIWFNWQGDKVNPGQTFQVVDGTITENEEVSQSSEGDTHYALYRVTAEITKYFDLTRFPSDDHLLTINIEDKANEFYELNYIADTESTDISSRVKIPGYSIYRKGLVVKLHSYKTNRGDPSRPVGSQATYSQLIYGIWISRPDASFYLKMFLALFISVIIAMLAFFIKPTDVDPRFGLGIGALFAAIANNYIISSLIPDTGIMTLADVVTTIGIAAILITLIQSTISLYIYDRMEKHAFSHLFDRVSFFVLLGAYIVVNVIIPVAALL